MQRTLQSELRCILIDALFKALGAVGMLTERTSGLADVVAHELCGFKHHIGGVILDLGIQTAHDACERNRLLTVTDHKMIRIQLEFLFIERDNRLILLCSADDDLSVRKLTQIECVHRLTDFLEDIVRDIDDIGDGADADECQSAAHPLRRLRNLHITDIVCLITRAEIRCLDRHFEAVETGSIRRIVNSRHFERLAECRCNLTRNAEDAHAVRTVCGDRNIVEPVIQPGHFLDIGTDRRILRQHEQTAVIRARIEVVIQTDLHAGAEHTLRFKALELALLDLHGAGDGHMVALGLIDLCADECRRIFAACADIIGAAADLECAVFAAVHLTHMEMCLGNRLASGHKTDHNAGDFFTGLRQRLDLKAAVKESGFQLLRRNININVFF